MRVMKRLMLGAGLVALTAGVAAAAPAVVQTDLTLRSGPGPRYAPVATLQAGTTVEVGGCGARWCRVAFEGGEGYANRAYLGFGSAAVGPGYETEYGYGTDYSYYDPGYDDTYYGDYGYYPGGGFVFWGGRWHRRDHDHHGDHHPQIGNNRGQNPSFASRNFAPRPGTGAPQGSTTIRTGQGFDRQGLTGQRFGGQRFEGQRFGGQNFGGNRIGASPSGGGTVGAGAPMARSTVGAGGPVGGGGAARIGGGGGGFGGGHIGGGGGGGGGGAHIGGGGGGHGGRH